MKKLKMKRFWGLVLAFALVLTSVPLTGLAETGETEESAAASKEEDVENEPVVLSEDGIVASGTCGENLTWQLDSEGTLTISGTGEMYNYKVDRPSHENDMYAPWYEFKDQLKSLRISEGVTSIGDFAFFECSGFTGDLMIPNSIVTIGESAFEWCTGFNGELLIPNSVTAINYRAFLKCKGLVGDLEIPDSVTLLGGGAFSGCSGFRGNLIIPNSVTYLGYRVFSSCSGFTGNLVIPDSVTGIGDYAFESCSGFTGNLEIPDSVTGIGDYAFHGCSGFTGDLVIPNSVTDIGDSAFLLCTKLEHIYIGSGVNSIGEKAFHGCESLTDISVDNNNYCSQNGVLFDKNKTKLICFPAGKSGNYEIPYGVITIAEHSFESCKNLCDVIIPSSVISIENNAFSYSNLSCITIPISVSSIGDFSFSGCESLTDVFFMGKALSIGEHAFYKNVLTSYYPYDDSTWTEDSLQNYGGTITWKKWNPETGEIIDDSQNNSSITFDQDYTCEVGKSISITATYISEDEPTDITWKCSDENAVTFSDTSVQGPSVTGEENTWWISTMVTGVTAGSYDVTVSVEDISATTKLNIQIINHIVQLTPDNNQNDVEISVNDYLCLYAEFDCNIELGDGNIYLCDYNNGKIYRTINNSDKDYRYSFRVDEKNEKRLIIELSNYIDQCIDNVFGYGTKENIPMIPYDTKLCIKTDPNAIKVKGSQEFIHIDDRDTWTFTTEFGLTRDIDMLQFSNESKYFDSEHWDISDSALGQVVFWCTSTKGSYADIIDHVEKKPWHGSCAGMVNVMALTKANTLDLSAWNALNDNSEAICANIKVPKNSKNEYGSRDLINYYQLLQFLDGYPAISQGLKSDKKFLSELIQEAENALNSKQFLPIAFSMKYYSLEKKKKEKMSHACLVIGVERDDKCTSLELYDPSYPAVSTKLIIDSDNNMILNGSWCADEKQNHNVPITAINYVDIDEMHRYNIDSFIKSTKESGLAEESKIATAALTSSGTEAYTLLSCSGSGNFTITNADGETLYFDDNDEIAGTMAVHNATFVGEGTSFEYKFEVNPSESFTYSTDDGNFSLSVEQNNFYLDAFATGDINSITIKPENSVSISGNGEIAYRTNFSYSDNITEMTAISGTTSGNMVASYENGEIILDSENLTNTEVKYHKGTNIDSTEYEDSRNGIIIGKELSEKNDISKYILTLSNSEYTYDGTEKEPIVTIANGDQALKEGTDYTVTYSNNVNAGTASVSATGKGNYTGTITKTFTIKKADQEIRATISSANLVEKETATIEVNAATGALSYSSSNTAVATVDKDGVVTAVSIGTATITITAEGNENYNPATTAIEITVTEKSQTHTHKYGDPVFEWSEDHTCKAIFTCNDKDDEQTLDCTVTNKVIDPTCTKDGKTVYTATVEFDGKIYTDIKTVPGDPATGHSYEYTDNGDGTHTATCVNGDDSFTEDHVFKDGVCICGAKESESPSEPESPAEPESPEDSKPAEIVKPWWKAWLEKWFGDIIKPDEPTETPEETPSESEKPSESESSSESEHPSESPTDPEQPSESESENQKPGFNFWEWLFSWLFG